MILNFKYMIFTFWGTLDEEFRSGSETAGFGGGTVRRHGFTIAGEFQGEFLLPFGFDFLSDADGGLATVSGLGDVEGIHFFGQYNEGGFGGFAYFLEGLFELVEIDGGVIAHDANGADFLKGVKFGRLDFLSLEEDLADWFVGGAGDFELVEGAVVTFDLFEDEHAGDGHLVGGQCAGLVGADDGGATQSFDGGQGPDNGILLGHTTGTQGETSGDDSGQTFWDGGYGESDSNFEVVDGTLDPGATVSGVIEVTNVDGPHSYADNGDDLRQLFTELIQFLLQGGLDFFSFRHFSPDFTDGGVQAGANDDTTGFAGGHVGTGEQDVLLVLVDGTWVGDGIGVLDNRDGFTGQDGLIDTEGGREDLDETNIGGDLVTDGHLHNISGNDVFRSNLLNTAFVRPEHFAHLRLVFLKGFNG